jgi:hypothetical protein
MRVAFFFAVLLAFNVHAQTRQDRFGEGGGVKKRRGPAP